MPADKQSGKQADGRPDAAAIQGILAAAQGTDQEFLVNRLCLRAMPQARYQPENEGHFGLASQAYCHFTSPIRRYPDLAIHRILSDVCAGMDDGAVQKKYAQFAAEASVQSSEREVLAMTVERDVEDCYKAEYMRRFEGEEFDGVISSITQFGLYVELPNTVEGLVRAQALSENALTLTEGVALRDILSGREWRLGDVMRVRVAGVDVSQGNVDFVPAQEQ